MKYLVNNSVDPHYNMAYDEWCLEHLDVTEPVFYLWRNSPSVIIGLNQNAYSEVNLPYLESHGIILARRVTGGGAVYHDLQNLNYTFIGREVDTAPFVQALRHLGIPAEVSGRNDVFVGGRKVSGYAKRVWKDRVMVHGTLMYDVDIDTLTRVLAAPGSKMEAKGIASVKSRVCNVKDICPRFGSVLELKDALQKYLEGYGRGCSEADREGEVCLDSSELAEIAALSAAKFSTWEWNYGHSREASVVRSAKLACGTVEARVQLDGGVIRNVAFTGDFLGRLSPEILAGALAGVRYDRESVAAALEDVKCDPRSVPAARGPFSVSDFFDEAGIGEIVSLIV